MAYGVTSSSGVVIGGEVVRSGGIPSREKVEHWLTACETVVRRAHVWRILHLLPSDRLP